MTNMIQRINLTVIALFYTCGLFYAQTTTQNINIDYLKIKGYHSVVHPIVTFDKNGSSTNFDNSYTVGFPSGINIFKSKSFGYSIEVVPFINHSNGQTKVSNVLFHPGLIFVLPKRWSLFTRMAFETTGRFGVTPSFSKIFHKTNSKSFFVSFPMPKRFGNDKPFSFTQAIQIGINF